MIQATSITLWCRDRWPPGKKSSKFSSSKAYW